MTVVRHYLYFPSNKVSSSQNFLNDVNNVVYFSDCFLQMQYKSADVPDVYFSLLNVAGISPTLVANRKAATKDSGNEKPFKI